MIIARHNKILYSWKKLKTNKKKNEMRIKENKEKKYKRFRKL